MNLLNLCKRHSRRRWVIGFLVSVNMGLSAANPAAAADYKEALARVLDDHKRLLGVQADLRASEAVFGKARAAWAPELAVSGNIGHSSQRVGADNEASSLAPREMTFSLNQLVWDFGKTRAEIDRAALQRQLSSLTVVTTKQDLLLEGLTAYINLHRARVTLDYARKSIDNIRRQTGQEESMVAIGSGLPTDVLQAKSQLAGAQAREVLAHGALDAAVNRYVAIYYEEPPELASIQPIPIPFEVLPATLEDAIDIAFESNSLLKRLALQEQMAEAEFRRVKGDELTPAFNLIAQAKFKENTDNIRGQRKERLVKFQMDFPFNLGLASLRSREAARESLLSARFRLDDAQDTLIEQVRNSWQGLLTARGNADFLMNQARITAEFLELARQERLLGTRSLIDVLTGETALINAESFATSAEADVGIAAFTLLRTIGVLSLDVLEENQADLGSH